MPPTTATTPLRDSVAKVNNEVAVGENLEFQRKWWRFEQGIWILFAAILILDVAGAFGRGWLAKKQVTAADHSINVKYERIERSSTPSIITINFDGAAIRNKEIRLFVSHSIVKELGAQRVIPQPKDTIIGEDGLTYIFPASAPPASVEIALEPTGPGQRQFVVQVPGFAPVHGSVFVMP